MVFRLMFRTKWGRRVTGAGGLLGGAALVDLAVNDDLDDLTSIPTRLRNKYNVKPEDRKKVVVLGTGWGSTFFLQKIDPSLYDVTIVSPRNHFFYTPLLTGVATGTVKASSIMEGIRQCFPFPRATFFKGQATDLNVKEQKVTIEDSMGSMELEYDHLVIGVGAEPNTFNIPGVQENAFFMKELPDAMKLRRKILDTLEMASSAKLAGRDDEVKKLLTFVIVGGGPTGVEFAAEFSDFVNNDVRRLYQGLLNDPVKIYLVEAFPNILNVFKKDIGAQVESKLTDRGVDVLTHTMVTGATAGSVTLKSNGETSTIENSTLVWTGGIRARPITQKLGQAIDSSVQTDRRGLVVDSCMRVKGAPENTIFALGDCAFSGKPPTAQVASQQGTYLGRQFRDHAANPTRPFSYFHKGLLAYIGGGEAVAKLPKPKMGLQWFTDLWEEHAQLETEKDHPEAKAHRNPPLASQKTQNFNVVGQSGYAVWRSVYFSKVISYRNRYNIGTDWLRSVFFGRNVSSALQESFKPKSD